MERFRFLASTLPYWVAGIGCYVPVLLRRVDEPNSYSGSFLDSISWATESLIVAGIGFPFVAAVFFLWRPQSKPQLAFGIVVSVLLFIGPAFQANWPGDYVRRWPFRVDCCVVACCMVASQALPVTLAYFTSLRLVNPSRITLSRKEIGRGISIWELLFLTFCCALCAALVMSVFREHAGHQYPSQSLLRRKGIAPLAMCFCSSFAALVGLRLHRFRQFYKIAWLSGVAAFLFIASLTGSYFSEYDVFPDISQNYIAERIAYRVVALLIVTGVSLFAFLGPLCGLGYRLDVVAKGEP